MEAKGTETGSVSRDSASVHDVSHGRVIFGTLFPGEIAILVITEQE